MRVEEEHGTVAPEHLLRAVAVVHVPVGDEDSRDAVLPRRVACADGDVVEDTESHASRLRGVMAGWPDGAEGAASATLEHRVHGGYHCARCRERRFEAARGNLGVARTERPSTGRDF